MRVYLLAGLMALLLLNMVSADNLTVVVTVQECITDDHCVYPPAEYFCTKDNLTCVYSSSGVCALGNCSYLLSCSYINGSCGFLSTPVRYTPQATTIGDSWLLLFLSAFITIGLAWKRLS